MSLPFTRRKGPAEDLKGISERAMRVRSAEVAMPTLTNPPRTREQARAALARSRRHRANGADG